MSTDAEHVVEEHIAHCPMCDTHTALGTYQTEFCPACGWVRDNAFLAELILCCNECRQPVALKRPSLTHWCTTCERPLGKKETFFRTRL